LQHAPLLWLSGSAGSSFPSLIKEKNAGFYAVNIVPDNRGHHTYQWHDLPQLSRRQRRGGHFDLISSC
jgi:hypothetical protein